VENLLLNRYPMRFRPRQVLWGYWSGSKLCDQVLGRRQIRDMRNPDDGHFGSHHDVWCVSHFIQRLQNHLPHACKGTHL